MTTLNAEEMKCISGGETYRADCSFCGAYWTSKYTNTISYNTAKYLCEGKKYDHELEVHYSNL